jgi:hypothetical protein
MTRNNKQRKKLRNKMSKALNDDIKSLSTDMQDILLDDLVTAFENRFQVLSQVQQNILCLTDVGVKVTI